MNAETTMVLTEGRPFPDAGKLLLDQARRITHALGFNRARLPIRPAPQHPLENLTFHSGTLCQIQQGQIAAEYMALSGVEIVGKQSLKELNDERCEYRFELNMVTDPIWRLYVNRCLPDVLARFESKVMILTCLPVVLERSYQRIRNAIEQANAWYGEEREQLIATVIDRDEQRRAAREMEQNRKVGLRRQFEHLEL
jgi:hypothetical protein